MITVKSFCIFQKFILDHRYLCTFYFIAKHLKYIFIITHNHTLKNLWEILYLEVYW
jgi:hypothetical protein